MTCVFVTGAAFIFSIAEAVDISDSAFSNNTARFNGGRIISLDNDNDNDNDTYMYLYVCPHFERVQIEWTSNIVALVVVLLYDLCAHDIHDRRFSHSIFWSCVYYVWKYILREYGFG